ncbi:hypothetical protein DFH09DRAFT_1111943 [Mycena vulgaris]|nr:hypothetical protein DFH09DRAFT_1111943 [Mycena vulgaris]
MPMNVNPHTGRYHFNHYSQTHRRYAPYTSAPTRQRDTELCSHDPSAAQMQAFQAEIAAARQDGIILGYSREERKLVQWFRPAEVSKNGCFRLLAASRFKFTPGLQMPLCAHAANGFRTTEETSLECKKVHNRWAFQCPIPGCRILIEIAPITSSKVLLTDQALQDYLKQDDYIALLVLIADLNLTDGDDLVSTDEEFDLGGTTIDDLNSPSSTASMQEFASKVLPSTFLSHSVKLFITLAVPIAPKALQWHGEALLSTSGCGEAQEPGVLTGQEDGTYETSEKPEAHPAWGSSDTPHEILLPYHPNSSNRRLADMMQNMTTPYGQIIRDFMSTAGIPRISLFYLCQQCLLCSGCSCMYSVDGYHQHRDRGICTGSVDLPKIPSRHPKLENIPFIKFRAYPTDTEYPDVHDFLDSTVGRAFLKWHSREGIPQDVWAVITTAYVHCKECDLVRCFEADMAHKDRGKCLDIGQGHQSSIQKGKGREMVLYRS